MARSTIRLCIDCNAKPTPKRPISKRGLCPKCGAERLKAFNQAMQDKCGPQWELWMEQTERALRKQIDLRALRRAELHAPDEAAS